MQEYLDHKKQIAGVTTTLVLQMTGKSPSHNPHLILSHSSPNPLTILSQSSPKPHLSPHRIMAEALSAKAEAEAAADIAD